ncbi:lysoplasmalogenase family protein [Erythrobacter sp. W53]|uniref:lysoplasmalogenase family protein n=1 Tax=Erythrobacter sp. W53 TaxID=3425947 RepID=UPI003D767D1A
MRARLVGFARAGNGGYNTRQGENIIPKRALVNHRPWLFGAMVAALAFYLLQDSAVGGLWLILLKGSAVSMLALYALRRGPGPDAKLLAGALALAAIGDMAIEITFEAGGIAFFLAHLAAITLFLKFPRAHPSVSQKLLAVIILILTPILGWLLSSIWQAALYGVSLGGMAAAAWMSRFPRYRVGAGAMLFLASDLLIFAQIGAESIGSGGFSRIAELAIWPLYFLGQFLIATGVVQTLRHELAEEDD